MAEFLQRFDWSDEWAHDISLVKKVSDPVLVTKGAILKLKELFSFPHLLLFPTALLPFDFVLTGETSMRNRYNACLAKSKKLRGQQHATFLSESFCLSSESLTPLSDKTKRERDISNRNLHEFKGELTSKIFS